MAKLVDRHGAEIVARINHTERYTLDEPDG
jgi:hypothetical protein